MIFDVITIFPHIFDSYLKESLIRRALEKKIIAIRAHDLRGFSADRHRKVDDSPFGGGPGMVLKIQPIYDAVEFAKRRSRIANRKTKVILFSTRGRKLDAKIAKRLSKYKQLILVCGRYEGVDERVAKHVADEEISVGDYVLSGGELPALVLIEAVSRFLPGFLGKRESLEEIKGSYPVYTRPEVFSPPAKLSSLIRANRRIIKRDKVTLSRKKARWSVPKVLLSGDHGKIAAWRSRRGEKV